MRPARAKAKTKAPPGIPEKYAKSREVLGENAALPEGWRTFKTKEGKTYYYHSKTGSVKWTHPAIAEEETPSDSKEAPSMEDSSQPLKRSRHNLGDSTWESRNMSNSNSADGTSTADFASQQLGSGTSWGYSEQSSSNAALRAETDHDTAASWDPYTIASHDVEGASGDVGGTPTAGDNELTDLDKFLM
eukprot:gnl/MRDRNA2_/MRDRNA2_28601_c0_seq1.p1 gnl/MRDRNA2_/MRDRNA2_28601_c0~~gnl/MRDRNA2_/MRDRNA2_28601_c0_seq1.p1  ORF type:complete len:189 (+),score=50.90 gnl/MRDRNA2_/MRDRNA2_28601_c0_seq1:150-716(+)